MHCTSFPRIVLSSQTRQTLDKVRLLYHAIVVKKQTIVLPANQRRPPAEHAVRQHQHVTAREHELIEESILEAFARVVVVALLVHVQNQAARVVVRGSEPCP